MVLAQRTIENSAAYMLGRLRQMKTQQSSPLKLLDVGCGPGSITVGFARELGADGGDVTGIDVNVGALDQARRAASTSTPTPINNIKFQQAAIHDLPFPDATFDVTCCHQVLCHVREPEAALREMLRVTKPSGFVAAREGDLESEIVWPEAAGFEYLGKFHQFIAAWMASKGGSPKAGRQLVSWALKAGARRDQITASYSAWNYTSPDEKENWALSMAQLLRAGPTRDAVIQAGLTTPDDCEAMAKAWETWAASEEATLAMMSGEIIVEK